MHRCNRDGCSNVTTSPNGPCLSCRDRALDEFRAHNQLFRKDRQGGRIGGHALYKRPPQRPKA